MGKKVMEKGTMIIPFKIESFESKALSSVDMPDGVERKAFGMPDDLEVFEFKGYASTFGNVDRGADVVKQGAFADFLRQSKASGDVLPVLWQHNFGEPVGIYLDMFEDDKGLFVHGIMPKSDTFVAGRVIPQMQVGSVRKMSIGYFINDMSWEGDIRQLEKLGLYEVSLVTIPMNTEADVTEMKKADGTSYNLDDLNAMTERDTEKLLKSGVCFSENASKMIVSALKSKRDAEDSTQRDAEKTLKSFVDAQDESKRSINETLKTMEKNNA